MEEAKKPEEKGLPMRALLYSMIALVIFGLVASNIGINLVWLESVVHSLTDRGVNYLISEAQRSADNVDMYIEIEINEVKKLSQDVIISDNANFFIDRFLKQNPAIREVSIINLDGKEENRYSVKEYFTEQDLRDFSFLEEFEKAKAGETFISRVDFTEEGEPYIKITAPIRKSELEQPRAVLRTTFYIKSAWGKTLETRIGETGRMLLVDDKGMLIADPDPSRVLKKINLLSLPPTKTVISGEIFDGAKYPNEKGAEVLGVGAPIKSLKWGVIIEQNTSELEAPVREVQKGVIVFLAAGIIITAVLIWLDLILKKADNELKKRYNTIESQSRRLEESKTSLEIRIEARTNELRESAGKLEEQIGRRTKQLQEKIQELEKFNRLAVGRELKMVELKEENMKLKEQLQAKPRSSKR